MGGVEEGDQGQTKEAAVGCGIGKREGEIIVGGGGSAAAG